MIKRFLLSAFLLCSFAPSVRADVDSDVSQISDNVENYLYFLEDIFDALEEFEALWRDPASNNFRMQFFNLVNQIKTDIHSIQESWDTVYPDLIQQYYHVINIDEYSSTIAEKSVLAAQYLEFISDVANRLDEVLSDYTNFQQNITVPLNSIDSSNTEIDSYVRAIYEDVDTIKALFLGEANLREMLETLWDIKNSIEAFQQNWDLQNQDLHEMWLDPFDNSGWHDPYDETWAYFDRVFDPNWTWSNGSRFISVTPSQWGAFDDICSGLEAILKGNEAMNYNLAYLCQGITIIASNLLNGVDMDKKYSEFQQDFMERQAQVNQQYDSLSQYGGAFSDVDSSPVTSIFQSQVDNFNNTFSRYSVQQLGEEATVTLNGLGGFGSDVSSVSGTVDMGSYSAFFVAARAVFGFLYWLIEFGFIVWLIGKCIKLYKFTLRMFCSLPRQVAT